MILGYGGLKSYHNLFKNFFLCKLKIRLKIAFRHYLRFYLIFNVLSSYNVFKAQKNLSDEKYISLKIFDF